MDKVLFIDKPSGMTSFGVVARIRRVLSKQEGKKVKVGHTGTLDPFATGLMIIVVGKECRNAGHYTKLDKVYEATVTLGQTSTTGDPEGEVNIYRPEVIVPTREQVERVLEKFTGEIRQRPPIFSAIKIDGQRAYKLARDGREIEMPERKVLVYSLELVSYVYPELKICVHVSSGTYIRSLAVDIGEALGTGAYCSGLRRTKIGKWDVDDASQLEEFGITN
ncbi:tRNA pseudouridine(55) synthase TruB [Candidatus Saccharibacteria bacterium oral taxon 955]